jgi:hypothetical protein
MIRFLLIPALSAQGTEADPAYPRAVEFYIGA